MARRAAREKALAAYIPLECGHFQTKDNYLHYDRILRKKGRAYCEQCNEMTNIKKPEKAAPLPEDPMF